MKHLIVLKSLLLIHLNKKLYQILKKWKNKMKKNKKMKESKYNSKICSQNKNKNKSQKVKYQIRNKLNLSLYKQKLKKKHQLFHFYKIKKKLYHQKHLMKTEQNLKLNHQKQHQDKQFQNLQEVNKWLCRLLHNNNLYWIKKMMKQLNKINTFQVQKKHCLLIQIQ